MITTSEHGMTEDLSALAWVVDEVRRSLEAAHSALRRHVREVEGSRGADLDSVDPSVLRQVRSHIHQSVGALELVGLGKAAQPLRATEAAVQRMSARPSLINTAAVRTIEQCSFALLDFLSRKLAGKAVSALSMFPQYRAVQELAGATRAHPADLWSHEWQWRELPADSSADAALAVAPMASDASAVGQFEIEMLAVLRNQPGSAARLSALCASLAAGAGGHLRSLWQLAAAFFEAQADGGLRFDVHAKRVASRLLAQLRSGPQGQASDRLAQDLLFFCAQVPPADLQADGSILGSGLGPLLASVRQAHGLADEAPVDYSTSSLGQFDPMAVAQARKRVTLAKEVWAAVASGDLARLPGLAEAMSLVGDSLSRLYPQGDALAQALQAVVAQCQAPAAAPAAELAMEVATALLYVEATLEDPEFNGPEMPERVRRLAQRLTDVRRGQDPGALELWMEQLYRQVSDRQTMGNVVQELRSSLSEIEKQIDQYFRHPAKREVLIPVPAQLSAMRGVLSLLDLKHASQAVLRMRDDVDALANTEVVPEQAVSNGTFERLADNLGALSFLIDMVSVQPRTAKSLFRFDPASGMLRAAVTRAERPSGFSGFDALPAAHPSLVERAQALAQTALQPEADPQALKRELESLSHQARAADESGLAALASSAQSSLALAKGSDGVEVAGRQFAESLQKFVATQDPKPLDADAPGRPVPAPSPPAAPGLTGLEGDGEMRDIFLEEAREVIAAAHQALAELRQRPDDVAALTVMRRGFHTLKGSSRMVGMSDFGEAAWACEQLFNAHLADAHAADADLCEFSAEVLAHLSRWVDAIEAGHSSAWHAATVVRAADALRLERRRLPLQDAQEQRVQDAPAQGAQDAPAQAALDAHDQRLDQRSHQRSAETEFKPGSLRLQDVTLIHHSGIERAYEPHFVLPQASAEFAAMTMPALPTLPEGLLRLDLDLPALPPLAAQTRSEIRPEFALQLPLAALPDLQADLPLPPLPPPLSSFIPAPVAETIELDAAQWPELRGLGTLHIPEPEPPAQIVLLPIPEVSWQEPAETELSVAPEAAQQSAPPAASLPLDDDPVKSIGPLRVSIALFNIFLNEADELSRHLCTELAEWALELHRKPGEAATVLAHSLAGNSATVGFTGLSNLARLLELALQRANQRDTGRPADATLFCNAADTIRSLLQQFAAGVLTAPDQPLIDALTQAVHALPDAELASVQVKALVPVSAPTRQVESSRHVRDLFEDDIDAVDAVDEELFSIFEDEAEELIPTLQSRLREWSQHPNETDAAAACLRTLHTLKGGARLAGAMQMGELAHRLENAIAQVQAAGSVEAPALERLAAQADALEQCFEALQARELPASAPFISLPAAPITALIPESITAAIPTSILSALAKPAALLPAAPLAQAPAAAAPAMALIAPHTEQAVAAATDALPAARQIDWASFSKANTPQEPTALSPSASLGLGSVVRVRAPLLDRLVNHAGEVSIARLRIEADLALMKGGIGDLTDNLERLRSQLREIELHAETQISTRMEAARAAAVDFDPLELDRFTRFQELTRMMAESVSDVATVQRGFKRSLQAAEDDLAQQGRLTRELQDDLLRTRMVEFDSLAERLYRVVRQAAKETGKQVRLDISGGTIEIDRGVLDRMGGAFEHLLRNSVVHGIEPPERRVAAGKAAVGTIEIQVAQDGNEVALHFRDDGAGLDLPRIRARALASGLLADQAPATDAELAALIFEPGFSTADIVTGLAGRGVGMDVVRFDVGAMGGRIETTSAAGQGTSFRLLLPLTTAVTQVVMMRCGELQVAVPSTLVDTVLRWPVADLPALYASGVFHHADADLPFYWLAALLQGSAVGSAGDGRTVPVVVIRSAAQRVAMHVDEVIGNQEVVVKNLGPQLSRLPGLAGMTLLPSGTPALIYNPVALAATHGQAARSATLAALALARRRAERPSEVAAVARAPLVLVVDDSLTVRRVTQRLLVREGYRVVVAKDGLEGLECLSVGLSGELPVVVLTDIEMPRMDGFDLVRNMRLDARLAALPVVMITSRLAQKHRDYAAELGVEHYLGKPYVEHDLLALVASFAQQRMALNSALQPALH